MIGTHSRAHTFISILLLLLAAVVAFGSTSHLQTSDQPAVDSQAAPQISLEAAAMGASGTVEVEVQIDSYGRVTAARAVSGDPGLHGACEEAARRWLFAPSIGDKTARKANLIFEFEAVSWNAPGRMSEFSRVGTYSMKIKYKRPQLADTISYIPADWTGQERCQIHHEVLSKNKVQIAYGLFLFDDGFLEIQKNRFPNANSVFFGGCVVEYAKYAEVLYCQKCRDAESEWSKTRR